MENGDPDSGLAAGSPTLRGAGMPPQPSAPAKRLSSVERGGSFSKREVSRAGAHLAQRLAEVRRGERTALVDESDVADVRAREVVEWWTLEHIEPMLRVYEAVERLAPPLDLGDMTITAVSFRPKRFESTIDKLTREPGKLADMADIGGVRAVVEIQADADELHEHLGDVIEVIRVRDWARAPRSTGYRALHLHVRSDIRTIEVQLRTFGQDAWANVVEEESRLSGVNYKAGAGSRAVLDFFRCVADFFGALELGESHPDLGPRLYEAYRLARPELVTPGLLDFKI